MVKGGSNPALLLCPAGNPSESAAHLVVRNGGSDFYSPGVDYFVDITGYTGTIDIGDFI